MQVTLHEVGRCNGCTAKKEPRVAALSLAFAKIGLCAGCRYQGNREKCDVCERDSELLLRRDLHGKPDDPRIACNTCQRDLRLLDRRDRYDHGAQELPEKVGEKLERVGGEVKRDPKRAIKAWLRE